MSHNFSCGVKTGKGRPKLLFLCQTLPYPPDAGAPIRSYHVLRLLAREFDITALCFFRAAERRRRADVDTGLIELRTLCDIEAFPIPQEHDSRRYVWDHLRSVAFRKAYTLYALRSSVFRKRLLQILHTTTFDLVHIDSIDLAAYLPDIQHLPTVLVHHNIESALLRRRAKLEGGWRRAYLSYQAKRVEDLERRWSPRAVLNVVVSPADEQRLKTLVHDVRTIVVPNGVDTQTFSPVLGGNDGIVFVGGLSWFPNADALKYFCDDILPLIRARNPGVCIRWVGRASEKQKKLAWERYGVELVGHVPDIRPYVHSAACYVVPLRVGGGTRLKILYAWAMGKAVVSTSMGCEGLATTDGQNILIRDDPKAFSQAVFRVLQDPSLRAYLGENGRRTAEQIYSWDVIGRPMIQEYRAVLASNSTSRDSLSRL